MAELITIETEAVYKATNGKYLRLRGSTAAAEVHRWVGYIKQSDVYTLSECSYIVYITVKQFVLENSKRQSFRLLRLIQ